MLRNILRISRQSNARINYFSSYTKQTTGLVGVPVQAEPREKFMAACENILSELQGIPAEAAYRQNVEAIYKHRLQVCKAETDVKKIEETVGLGHIEELLQMAKDELSLIPKYVNGRMWEEPWVYKSLCELSNYPRVGVIL